MTADHTPQTPEAGRADSASGVQLEGEVESTIVQDMVDGATRKQAEGSQSAEKIPSTGETSKEALSPAPSSESKESGEASPLEPSTKSTTSELVRDDAAPPLPDEPLPKPEDDGWDFHWDETHQAYFFHNRFTNEMTWENPRILPGAATTSTSAKAEPPKDEPPPAGGYNPAIHGDYDPNAWYAQQDSAEEGQGAAASQLDPSTAYQAIGAFNRFTGRWQSSDQNPDNHGDEAKSNRQMNAYFDVDAAANSHDGRSLKAERAGKKPTKNELKHFKEKRRAKKEEKRRAWLRD